VRIAFDGIGKSAAEILSDESRFRYNAKLVRLFVRWKATLPDKSSPKNILSGERLIARTNGIVFRIVGELSPKEIMNK